MFQKSSTIFQKKRERSFNNSVKNLAGKQKQKRNHVLIEIPYILIAPFNGSTRTTGGSSRFNHVGFKKWYTTAWNTIGISSGVAYLSRGTAAILSDGTNSGPSCTGVRWVPRYLGRGIHTWAISIERGAQGPRTPRAGCPVSIYVCMCVCARARACARGVVSSVNGLALCGSWNKVPPARGEPGRARALMLVKTSRCTHVRTHTHTRTHGRTCIRTRHKRVAATCA